jgi:tetratricopeptide (TPR) repeat protein
MRTGWVLAILFVVLAGGLARADSKKTNVAEREARQLFERGEAHYKAGLYSEALEEYEAGYAASPLPGFLINIAQCQRRLGDLERARTTYRKFIVVAPDSRFVPEVKSVIAELDKLLEERTATNAPSEPPPVADTVTAAGAPPAFDASKTPEVKPQAPTSLMASSTSTPPAPAETGGTRWWLWGTLGAVVVAGAVAGYVLARDPGTVTLHDGSLGTLRR